MHLHELAAPLGLLSLGAPMSLKGGSSVPYLQTTTQPLPINALSGALRCGILDQYFALFSAS